MKFLSTLFSGRKLLGVPLGVLVRTFLYFSCGLMGYLPQPTLKGIFQEDHSVPLNWGLLRFYYQVDWVQGQFQGFSISPNTRTCIVIIIFPWHSYNDTLMEVRREIIPVVKAVDEQWLTDVGQVLSIVCVKSLNTSDDQVWNGDLTYFVLNYNHTTCTHKEYHIASLEVFSGPYANTSHFRILHVGIDLR